MDNNQKGIIKNCEIAHTIIRKKINIRNDDENKWLKLNGGIYYHKDFYWGRTCPTEVFSPTLIHAKDCKRDLYLYMKGTTLDDLVEVIKIFKDVTFWNLEKKKIDNKKFFEDIQKEIIECKNFLKIKFPIPVIGINEYIRNLKKYRKDWQKDYENKIALQNKEKERLRLIKKFKLEDNISFEKVKEIEVSRIRKRLGIAENVNLNLSKDLYQNLNKNLKKVDGYIYIRRWKLNDGTKWFKIGKTNDLERRESEQNVLPVSAETLATAKLASMQHANVAEQTIHKIIKKYQIKNANNKELFKLEPEDLASIIDLFEKIDLRNQ